MLKEIEQLTDFVEGQAHGVDQMSNLQDNLQAEFATSQHAGNLAIPMSRSAIDFIGDQDAPTVLQSPHRPRMGELTLVRRNAFGIHFLGPLRPLDLVLGAVPAASSLRFALGPFLLAAFFLTLLFLPQGIRLFDFRRGGASKLLLKLLDP